MSIDSAKRVMSGTFGELWWDGELIAVDPVAERHQLWRIHGS